MTREEKDILISELCSRLPYEVTLFCQMDDEDTGEIKTLSGIEVKDDDVFTDDGCTYDIEYVKPFLYPISELTEEDNKELLDQYLDIGLKESLENTFEVKDALKPNYAQVKWLYEHHIDFNGLIEKGLAINKIDEETFEIYF